MTTQTPYAKNTDPYPSKSGQHKPKKRRQSVEVGAVSFSNFKARVEALHDEAAQQGAQESQIHIVARDTSFWSQFNELTTGKVTLREHSYDSVDKIAPHLYDQSLQTSFESTDENGQALASAFIGANGLMSVSRVQDDIQNEVRPFAERFLDAVRYAGEGIAPLFSPKQGSNNQPSTIQQSNTQDSDSKVIQLNERRSSARDSSVSAPLENAQQENVTQQPAPQQPITRGFYDEPQEVEHPNLEDISLTYGPDQDDDADSKVVIRPYYNALAEPEKQQAEGRGLDGGTTGAIPVYDRESGAFRRRSETAAMAQAAEDHAREVESGGRFAEYLAEQNGYREPSAAVA